jgi:hypothetical protein
LTLERLVAQLPRDFHSTDCRPSHVLSVIWWTNSPTTHESQGMIHHAEETERQVAVGRNAACHTRSTLMSNVIAFPKQGKPRDPNDFDFDMWAALARTDPEAFERLRTETIEKACQRALEGGVDPERVAQISWRIAVERDRAKNPLQSCLRLSSLMWDRFHDLTKALERYPFTRK